MIDLHIKKYNYFALVSALLFSISTPAAKLLLNGSSPQMFAGLLSLGQGLGLTIVFLLRKLIWKTDMEREPGLRGVEFSWLAGVVLAGGVLAPLLLMIGLSGASASGSSLLLNTEGILTTLLAALLFGEAVGPRIWFASFIMLVAGVLLAYEPNVQWGISLNALAVLGACFMWALDNNLSRHISARDPVMIAMIKGLTAGSVNFGIGWFAGGTIPAHFVIVLILGFLCFGLSLVLFIYALRHLGSARAGIYFSVAPFLGAGISFPLLGEKVSSVFIVAFVMMVVAAWMVFGEQHEHEHVHDSLEHEHMHDHDIHHMHNHPDSCEGPHSHTHTHEPMVHAHRHVPDAHHRHAHS
jgi:drug/metabolite transporter (DMT)-like permease